MNTLSINYLADELRRLDAVNLLPPEWSEAWNQENWFLLSDRLLAEESVAQTLLQAEPQAMTLLADYMQHALLFRQNLRRLNELQKKLSARLQTLLERPDFATLAHERLAYYHFLKVCLTRTLKKCAIESFETEIEEIDWPPVAHPLRARYAFWVGYVYLNESQPEWRIKCRPWLEKAIQESRFEEQTIYQAYLLYYYLTAPVQPDLEPLKRSLEVLRQSLAQHGDEAAVQHLWAEIELLWLRYLAQREQSREARLEATQTLADSADQRLQNYRSVDPLLYLILSQYKIDGLLERARLERADVAEYVFDQAISQIESCVSRAEQIGDAETTARLYLRKGDIFLHRVQLREAQRMYREALTYARQLDLPALWPQAFESSVEAAFRLGKPAKAIEQLCEGFQFALHRLAEGGFALFLDLLRYANGLFEREARQPGISWMVSELEAVFRNVEQLHELLPEHVETIGREKFSYYQTEYLRFEPISRRNVRVHLRYQLHQIKALQLSALFSNDVKAQQIAESLLLSLNQRSNPLSFIQADWQDFRDVPNLVRNQVLNRCISITKGDLPLAAEHLNFSYRNLRSYISLGEVNRLGFFLDELDTTARPLETGVRLLLHDLYENGTLFESIFDLPAFIVRRSAEGFTTTDMESELNIKYNTAKKYLKLMCDQRIIEIDRTPHRKGHYLVLRDRILSRYLEYKEAREARAAAKPTELTS